MTEYRETNIIVEHKEPWCFLGYAMTEGEMWTIVLMSEEEVDKLIQEFKAYGTITLSLRHLMSSEVREPVAVAKLSGDGYYFKVPRVERIDEGGEDSGNQPTEL